MLRSSYFMFKRMIRGYFALLLLVGLPMALISVTGLVSGQGVDSGTGLPMMHVIAVTYILAFQLFGGAYTMEYMSQDLFSPRRWRLHSLPYSVHLHANAIGITGTLFSTVQGLILVLFTQWIYGVTWGSYPLVYLTLLAIAIPTNLVSAILVLGVSNAKLAERLGEIYGFGSMVLAGVWFPFPDVWGFNLLTTYGSPLSLGRNIVYALMTGTNESRAMTSFSILVGASVVLTVVVAYLGRRKLA